MILSSASLSLSLSGQMILSRPHRLCPPPRVNTTDYYPTVNQGWILVLVGSGKPSQRGLEDHSAASHDTRTPVGTLSASAAGFGSARPSFAEHTRAVFSRSGCFAAQADGRVSSISQDRPARIHKRFIRVWLRTPLAETPEFRSFMLLTCSFMSHYSHDIMLYTCTRSVRPSKQRRYGEFCLR